MIPFIGMTGGIGCGKSTVSAQFASLGVTVVDADDVGHNLYEAGCKATRQIKREFGAEFIDPAGAVDRNLLREAVFTDVRLRRRLEEITHPLIRKECLLRMSAATGVYGFLVAPLMFEANFITDQFERILVIDCTTQLQSSRGLARGRFSKEQIKVAMKSQVKREDRIKRANDVLVNNGDLETLANKVQELHIAYLEMFSRRESTASDTSH